MSEVPEMERSRQSGWVLAVRDDPSGRRGFWYRETVEDGRHVLELCAGREGDDVYVRLVEGESITVEQLREIICAAEHARSPERAYESGEVEARVRGGT